MRSASRGCWRRPHRVAKTRGTGWRIAGGIRWRNRVEQGGENPWNPQDARSPSLGASPLTICNEGIALRIFTPLVSAPLPSS